MLSFQRTGDLAAFDLLYQRHRAPLLTFALRLAGDIETAREVSQQTWLQLLEAAGQGRFRPARGPSFRAYLYAMARNRFIDDHVRRADVARTEAVDAPETLAAAAGADDVVFDAANAEERRRRLAAALQALPPEQREVMAMWSTGMSADEVAQVTGAPRNTVLSRKRYALKKLETLLQASGWSTDDE